MSFCVAQIFYLCIKINNWKSVVIAIDENRAMTFRLYKHLGTDLVYFSALRKHLVCV